MPPLPAKPQRFNAPKCIREATILPRRVIFINHRHPLSFHSHNHPLTTPLSAKPPRRRIHPILAPALCRPLSTPSSDPSPPPHHAPDPRSTPFFHWPTHPDPTPYEVFHLPRTASTKEIKARYTLLVKQYHPDHAPHVPVDRFRKVVESYKILSHPSSRADYDHQHPPSPSETSAFSEFRQPWSGSRLSRRKTDHKGPPPSGGWSYTAAGRARRGGFGRPDYSKWSGDAANADNAHFNYEKYYARQMAQEAKLKERMDMLHARKVEEQRAKESAKSSRRVGVFFTGSLFLMMWMIAQAMKGQ